MKLTKLHKFVLCKFSCSAKCEKRNFAKSLLNFAKFRKNFDPRDCKQQSYVTSSISWLAPNIILIEKKNWSTDSFVSDDPLVYEPVCYEMVVGKEYYANNMYVLNKDKNKGGGAK